VDSYITNSAKMLRTTRMFENCKFQTVKLLTQELAFRIVY